MIVNLTQHPATAEQAAAGVVDLGGALAAEVHSLLTFNNPPSRWEVYQRADRLAEIAKYVGASAAMIGGAGWLMSALETALIAEKIAPCYAFSQRVVTEEPQADGSVRKTSTFRHIGWVYVD